MIQDIDAASIDKIKRFILDKTGIYLNDQKISIVLQKLKKQINEGTIKDLNHFYYNLMTDEKVLQDFINFLTVNETYFFREFEQLKAFAEVILPEVIEFKKKNGEDKIKIWVAGCATGDEAYTVSIILNEFLEDGIKFEIFASDIDTEALKIAELGIYEMRNVRFVHHHYLNRYFDITNDGKFKVKDQIKRNIKYIHHNLIDFGKYFIFSKTDFIFCRNVLIYFGDEQRKKVIDKMYEILNCGGYLFLGHSESVGRLSDKFNVRRINDYFFYYKECESGW
jgi:chemotaxis protein methyltransferase CheR